MLRDSRGVAGLASDARHEQRLPGLSSLSSLGNGSRPGSQLSTRGDVRVLRLPLPCPSTESSASDFREIGAVLVHAWQEFQEIEDCVLLLAATGFKPNGRLQRETPTRSTLLGTLSRDSGDVTLCHK